MACRSWSAPAIIWTRVRRSHNSRMGSEASGNQRLLQGQRWVSGDIRLPRASQEELTRKARAIIAEAGRPLIPPAPPTISIRECQEAIEIAGVIPITLRGEQVRITEIATRDISRWVSGDIRFTPKEKELLTKRARAIIADKDKASHLSSRETRGGAHATHQ